MLVQHPTMTISTPELIATFSKLAQWETWTERDERLDQMEKLYSLIDHGSREGIVLCFALAKIYDDLDDVDRSFALLEEGNRLHKRGKTDTVDDARKVISQVRRLFQEETESLSEPQSAQPVFVLGMPRSGTSLVEQILSAHPRVSGGGELKLMGQWCVGFLRLREKEPDTTLSRHYLEDLRRHYGQGLRPWQTEPWFTDKMPQNFLWIGFILAAFPNARIIHTTRDPMAVCWSVFKTDFAGASHGYACDLADIGEFYTLYTELMAFWRERYPQAIYELSYESLCADQEQETRKLLEHCGLSWDEACLAFHNNPRTVQTASWAQVKRPLYQGSSESWKRYRQHLGPLIEALGSLQR